MLTIPHWQPGRSLANRKLENGIRYTVPGIQDVELIGFIRGAQALGFSLAEIREILPQLAEGTFDRTKIEHQLSMKVAQVDAHMNQLQTLKKELLATFALLKCTPNKAVSTADATAIDSGSGVGTEITRNTFSKQKKSSS